VKQSLLLANDKKLEIGKKPIIMGIVNITPDSFFPDSRKLDPERAVEHAVRLLGEGADILDFGAESSRPGSKPVSLEEERERLIPVLKAFRRRSNAPVSVDTRHSGIAREALDEGADIINDITALGDPMMARVVADAKAALVLMHMQGEPATMQENPSYQDCAGEVRDFLKARAEKALEAGVGHERIVLDPGIGFGKLLQHNLDLLSRLYLLIETGYPVLVGMSRKRFVGEITGKAVEERLAGSLGAACAAWANGASIFRVHDVAATKDALSVFTALTGEQE